MKDDGTDSFLLIARKAGSSSSRRQRRFPDRAALDRAQVRWAKEDFDTWWIYGPSERGADGFWQRPVIAEPPR